MEQFQEERLYAAATNIRMLERCIEQTIDYTKERVVFDQPLIDNQVIRFKLAELQTEIMALRALVYNATAEYVAGHDVTTKASMAKLLSGRLSRTVSDACLQYYGGAGFMWDAPISRAYRDARLGSIGGGADEVMLEIISKKMGMSR